MRRAPLLFVIAFTAHCSWCAAPKPTPEDDPLDRDAAPHTDEIRSRCEVRSKVALPGAFELGRVANVGARVAIGARRGAREGVLDTDGLTARFTEVADAIGDLPPPLPITSGERTLAIEYEGKKDRRIVIRDAASPASAIAELAPEAPDESLAYDATFTATGAVAIAWDAPAEEGSAIWATIVRDGKSSPAVRLSPPGVDADTPRLVAIGPTLLAMWIAHRALPKSDAAAQPEGAGQDLDHAWIELLAFDESLAAQSPLRHLTQDSARVAAFDVVTRGGNQFDVVGRDAIELQAGQGGSAFVAQVRGPDLPAPIVLADHVGRGVSLLLSNGLFLFDDATDRGRALWLGASTQVSPEPALDASRPLAALPSGDLLIADVNGTELRVVRCAQ